MNWYVAKIIFQIVSGDGSHYAQFDEQLRLISAKDELEAYKKANNIGLSNQDSFINNRSQPVQWKFIDVAEIIMLNALEDGAELYYHIHEAPDADLYMAWAHHKSSLLRINN